MLAFLWQQSFNPEMKYMRRTEGYIWTDYKTNAQIAKELKITPILDKLLEYKRNWIQHVNRKPRNRLPRVMKRNSSTGRRNHGRPLKETSWYVRRERVNKWPNSMKDIWWWWWWWWWRSVICVIFITFIVTLLLGYWVSNLLEQQKHYLVCRTCA